MANLIDQITTPQSNLDGTEQLYGVKDETTDVRFPTQLVADLVVVSTSQIQDNAVVSAKVSEAIRLSLGKADSAQQPPSEGAFVDGDKTKLDTYSEANQTANNAKVTYPSADSTKVGHISVTQAVNLDTMESDIANKANTADLATVATSGDYDDLSNKPDLSAFDNISEHANAAAFPKDKRIASLTLAETTALSCI